MYRLLLLGVLTLSVSCSQSYYIQPVNESVATISFSNLSDEMADIYIISNDMKYKIKSEIIEKKQPQYRSKYKTNVLADNKVTFRYVYNWLISEKTEISTSYSNFMIPGTVSIKKVKDTRSCSSQISFVPEKNKHYAVYFGVFSNKCVIKASEVRQVEGKKNVLLPIKAL